MSYEQPTFPPQGWQPGDGTPAKPVSEQPACPLCEAMIERRQKAIAKLRERITRYQVQIVEIGDGDRHHDSHDRYMTTLGLHRTYGTA